MSEDVPIRHDHSVDTAWDFYDCNPEAITDPEIAEELYQDIIAAGFTPACPYAFARFEGGGISFVQILKESHAAIHGSPENAQCVEVTIHTCHIVGGKLDPDRKTTRQKTMALYDLWVARLKPKEVFSHGGRIRVNRHSTICPPRIARQEPNEPRKLRRVK